MNDSLAVVENPIQELATTSDRQVEIIKGVLAAREEALVKARATVAMGRPRDIETVRQKLKEDCEREGFAECAYYRIKNRGEGLSINFAKAALRAMTNIDVRSQIIHDDDDMRIIETSVVDLESNSGETTQIIVSKTVERKYLAKGEVAISHRVNSKGETIYTRRATDDEVLAKQNAAISKTKRNGILMHVPGDILFECKRRILQIWDGDRKLDLKQQSRKIIDSFASLNVSVSMLTEYLGHKIETSSPSEMDELRNMYRSIRSGETTWHAIAAEKEEAEEPKPSSVEALKQRLEKEAEENRK